MVRLRVRNLAILVLGVVFTLIGVFKLHSINAVPGIEPWFLRKLGVTSSPSSSSSSSTGSDVERRNVSSWVSTRVLHLPTSALVTPNPPPPVPALYKLSTLSPTHANITSSPSTSLPVANQSKAYLHEDEILEGIRKYTNTLPNTTEVSVITAYFNLGPLNKRAAEGPYTPNLYKRWMYVFRWLENPLVVFADTEETAAYFRELRAAYPPDRTTVIVLKRQELWAFGLEGEIKKIYAQKGYPKHQPNTVNPLYSCAMHAKFELIQKVLRERLYQTRFVAWLDIGLFRDEVKKNKPFNLAVPYDFKRTHVGYSQVNKFKNMTVATIIGKNEVWVGGASFLATPEVAYIYCSDYRRAVRKMLDMKWMSTDQQVIYAMMQPSFQLQRRFKIQAYTKNVVNIWFSMGYLMKNATITKL